MDMKKASECWCPMVRYGGNMYYQGSNMDTTNMKRFPCIGSKCAMWARHRDEYAEDYAPEGVGENEGRCGLSQGQWMEDDV